MINEVIDFVAKNQEVIIGAIVVVISLVTMGRKRALNFVKNHLGDTKEEVLKNIDEHAPTLARYIYSKLPKTAKLFVTAKVIEKQIHKFIATLDKK